MNCIKCPIAEECGINNGIQNQVEYILGMGVPVSVKPYSPEECPLIQAVVITKTIKDKGLESTT